MIKTINATTLKSLLDTREAILVDVREADEFRAEHIGHALSFPLSTLHNHMELLDFPLGSKIVFQCLGGVRSNNACMMVEDALAEKYDIYNLEGGFNAWKKAGLPIVSASTTSSAPPTTASCDMSIFRQVQMIVGSLVFFCILLGFLVASGFFILAGIFGGMLAFAGYSGWCGLAMLLQRAPWNKAK